MNSRRLNEILNPKILETPDGYPYPSAGKPDDNWKWIKGAKWTDSKPANDYMVFIGDRAATGLKGLLEKLGKGSFKFIAHALSFLIDVVPLPIPGKSLLSTELNDALRRGVHSEIKGVLDNLYTELEKTIGLEGLLDQMKILTYLPNDVKQDMIHRFDSMPRGFDRSLCIHWHVERWGWQRAVMHGFDFAKDEAAKATYMTAISARVIFTRYEWFTSRGFRGKERKFFAGDGCPTSLIHFSGFSTRSMKPGSKADRKDMSLICKNLSLIEFTDSETEALEYQDRLKELAENADKGFETKTASTQSVIALLGLGLTLFASK